MSITLPGWGLRLRLLSVLVAVGLLLWMSTEDNSATAVAALGVASTLLLLLGWLLRRWGGTRLPLRAWLPGSIALGGLAGAGSALTAALLMFFKTAWHAHLYPDFPPQMMLDMLARLPVWGAAGAFIALGIACVRLATLPITMPDEA